MNGGVGRSLLVGWIKLCRKTSCFTYYCCTSKARAVDYLTRHYRVRQIRIILNGRKVGNGDIVVYFENKAYFTKKGLNKRTVLHELFHHLVYVSGLEMPQRMEEKAANDYARNFLSQHS